MNPTSFDQLSKRLSRRLSRRAAVRLGASGAAAMGGAGVVLRAAAQATPAAASRGEPAANNATLFVQTAAAGTFIANSPATPVVATAPPTAAAVPHTLTLTGHSGVTVAFSDRPRRDFGQLPTPRFFQSMDFTPHNPPNAALVVSTPQQPQDILLLELITPAFDASTMTLTYGANGLQAYHGEGLQPLAAQEQDQQIAPAFDNAALFIDDCPDITKCDGPCTCSGCWHCDPKPSFPIPGGPYGTCWDWGRLLCRPCNQQPRSVFDDICNHANPACNGRCRAF